jgi:hypothetical protein
MHLAYFDESVDDDFFVLAAVLVHEAHWLKNLDSLLRMRRAARKKYGIPITAEIKAMNIRGGSGPLAPLNWPVDKRGAMFNSLFAWQRKDLDTRVFAVAIAKKRMASPTDPRELAWRYTLDRVDTFCRKEASLASMYPDAGHGYFIRRMVRKMRRYAPIKGKFGGVLQRPCERIVEDPSDRHSHESLFVQLADWAAYAALRSSHLAPKVASFATAWDQLGSSLIEVEKLTKPPHVPGMKVFPK